MASATGYRPTSQQVTVQADATVAVNLGLTPWSAFVYLPLVLRQN
jgi:hypothetical protein